MSATSRNTAERQGRTGKEGKGRREEEVRERRSLTSYILQFNYWS